MLLDIKPLSVNEAWHGQRFKTPKYNKYIKDMLRILPKITVPKGELALISVKGRLFYAHDSSHAIHKKWPLN